MDKFSVRITAESFRQLQALDEFDLDLHRRAARGEGGKFVVHGILTRDQINRVETAGYKVEELADLSRVAEARLQEVSRVDRFAGVTDAREFEARTVSGYLTPEEVDTALTTLTALNPALLTLITLPNNTHENRQVLAVRLRGGTKADRIGVFITGSIHAREWGGSDICIQFLTQLINTYKSGGSLVLGGKTFTHGQVQKIVENLDIFVLPDVNPDGKKYSQTVDTWWRKNRNPAGAVDLNRNFDFLWSSGIGTSTSVTSQIYKGTAPFSEPETRNVRHMFDTYTNIRYFVDVHSYSQLMLYNWGDDTNQNITPAQNFLNPIYDGLRGNSGDLAYKEFIATLDHNTEINLGQRMNSALTSVRGKVYTLEQSCGLYPTSGTSDDYAFCRHFADPSKKEVYAYTIEFGTEFIPPYAEMQNIMKDVTAALTELCWAVNSDIFIRDSAADIGDVPSIGAFWDSPDIWVRNAEDGVTTHQNTIRGQDNFLYVRMKNRGLAEARNVKVRACLVHWPGTEFIYPGDWIPVNPSGGGSITSPGTYLIGETTVPVVPSGVTEVVHFKWVKALVPPDLGWHPCLLVEIAPNDGPAATGGHVWDNNNLGQKNITIVNAKRGKKVKFSFKVGSRFGKKRVAKLSIHRRKAPSNALLCLQLQEGMAMQPSRLPLETAEAPVTEELVGAAVGATLVKPTTVALSGLAVPAKTGEAFFVRLPAETRLEFAGQEMMRASRLPLAASAGLWKPVSGEPQLFALGPVKTGALALNFNAGETKDIDLQFTVPRDARTGETYELEAVQSDELGRAVGGVVLRINVVE